MIIAKEREKIDIIHNNYVSQYGDVPNFLDSPIQDVGFRSLDTIEKYTWGILID